MQCISGPLCMYVEHLINLIRVHEAYSQSSVIWEYLAPNRGLPIAVYAFSLFFKRNQLLNVPSVLSECPDSKIEHFSLWIPW